MGQRRTLKLTPKRKGAVHENHERHERHEKRDARHNHRNGKLYTRETIEVLDHDFPSYSEGKVVPHGLYDIGLNKAHVNLGASRDTTEFACDSVARW